MRQLFGTDGIRGCANIYPITAEVALRLGRAAGYVFMRDSGHKAARTRILIGKDTRLSGYMIENALVAGLTSMGVDAVQVGPMPTPAVALLTISMRCDAGIMISASHNPYQDNGIKFFSHTGFKLPDEVELEIEELVLGDALDEIRPVKEQIGRAHRITGAVQRYAEFVKGTIPRGMSFEGMRIVVDCANGSSYRVAPEVFMELGAEVKAINIAPNGTNINRDCGAVAPGRMCEAVREYRADVGLAFDGDADRLICADREGRVVDGDAVMMMCASAMKEHGTLKKDTLVTTVMSNAALEVALKKEGIAVKRTAVGDRYVTEEMVNNGYNLGGEQSGHVVFLDHNTTGDALITALQVLSLMRERGKTLKELASGYKPLPSQQVGILVREKIPFEDLDGVQAVFDEVRGALGENGRLLVRYSGTESKARILVEGVDRDQIREMADRVATTLATALNGSVDG